MPTDLQPAPVDTILIVDDDASVLRSMDLTLRDAGFARTLLCGDSREVVALVRQHAADIVLLDLVMPHIPGERLLDTLRREAPGTPVIIVTATDDVDTAVRCIRAGAYDYLTKPLDSSRLVTSVFRALEFRRLQAENTELRRRVSSPSLSRPEVFDRIATQSPSMLSLFGYVEAVAQSAEPVLIVGETGVGKELFADALHRASVRTGELVAVNVAGLDETAFADTLFGHTKGAFTGAAQIRQGLVERAAGGTLFLDEIGDLKLDVQAKVLRLIQEREFLPLGADRHRRTDCRIVAATNRDLRVRMREGRFRDDLYYRLHAHMVRVPPLRERLGDLPLLIRQFLSEAAAALGKAVPTPPKELPTHLMGYAFPGNVRELRAMVFDAVTRHDKGVLSLSAFLEYLDRADTRTASGTEPAAGADAGSIVFGRELPDLKETTRLLLREALRRAGGNQAVAARMIGLSRRTVNRYAASGDVDSLPGQGA